MRVFGNMHITYDFTLIGSDGFNLRFSTSKRVLSKESPPHKASMAEILWQASRTENPDKK